MYRFLILLAVCLSAAGCIRVSPGRQAQAMPAKPKPSAEVKHDACAKGIEIKAIYGITVQVGDTDGTPLSERIDAVHRCGDTGELSISYGSPQHGTLKAYGYDAMNAHIRYYPPAEPCEDSVPVEIQAADGCRAKGVINIQVVAPGERSPEPEEEPEPAPPTVFPGSDAEPPLDSSGGRIVPCGHTQDDIAVHAVIARTGVCSPSRGRESASLPPSDEAYYELVVCAL